MFRVPSSSMHRAVVSLSSRQSALLRQQPWRPKIMGRKKNDFSTTKENSTTGKKSAEQAEAERQQVLHKANETMRTYHHARLAKLRGELPSKRKTEHEVNYVQVGVVVFFLIAFAASPFLGKKIAYDKEFREKYIPEWWDFTVKKPTSELSREEVHEQILQLQKEIRARAIKGDFSDEKIHKMRRYKDGLEPDKGFNPDNDEHAWSKLHPGVDDDEEVEDEEVDQLADALQPNARK